MFYEKYNSIQTTKLKIPNSHSKLRFQPTFKIGVDPTHRHKYTVFSWICRKCGSVNTEAICQRCGSTK